MPHLDDAVIWVGHSAMIGVQIVIDALRMGICQRVEH